MELFPKKRWLLCEPRYYEVAYEINPWMSLARPSERSVAYSQWRTLHHTLIRLGVWVEYVEPVNGLPDLVFTANAGLVKGKKAVLSKFRYKERQGEEEFFRKWFESNGYTVTQPKCLFEGEGDALFSGDTLYGGYGFRTDKEGLEESAKDLSVSNLIPVKLIDSRYYHLDTCFCPFAVGKALFVRSAFESEGIKALEKNLQLFEVPPEEGVRFACNAVVLGDSIVLPDGCPKTEAILRSHGVTPYAVKLEEFLKAGGSAKCLTLQLDR